MNTGRTGAAIVAAGLLAGLGAVPSAAAPVPPGAGLPPPTRQELTASANNLKQILLAFHNYESTHGHFPNNAYTKDGKPLLSWRVVILPFFENANKLDLAFKPDEPWDGEHNRKLIARMPKVYAPVRVKAKEGETFYRGFQGKGAPFGPDKGAGLRIAAVTDGLSNTGLVFEAAEPVVWTKPDDLPFDPAKDLPRLGGLFDGQFHVGFADGSVRLARKDPDEKALRALIGYNDGEVFDEKGVFGK